MADGVEELGQINIHCDVSAVLDGRLHLPERLVCIAAWSKGEAQFREGRVEYRREHLGYGLLDNPVRDGGDAQRLRAYSSRYVNRGNTGIVSKIIEMPQQFLLAIEFNGKEILVPIVDEIVKSIDHKTKTIYMEAPEGLIELYL